MGVVANISPLNQNPVNALGREANVICMFLPNTSNLTMYALIEACFDVRFRLGECNVQDVN